MATDFDGVLAPLVARPDDGPGRRRRDRGPAALAALPGVTVAAGVRSRPGHPAPAHRRRRQEPVDLVGSHGARDAAWTDDGDAPTARARSRRELLARLTAELEAVVRPHAGGPHRAQAGGGRRCTPAGLEPTAAAAALEDAAATAGAPARGPRSCRGKQVVELARRRADKGTALRGPRAADVAPEPSLYLGDDVTDEGAFEALGPDDVDGQGRRRGDRRGVPGGGARTSWRPWSCRRRAVSHGLLPYRPGRPGPCGATGRAPEGVLPQGRTGAAPVEPRTTSSGRKTYSARGAGSPAISSISARTAASPIACTVWRTVVSGGSVKAMSGRVVVAHDRDVLGHLAGRAGGRARIAPSAIRSEPQTIAVQPALDQPAAPRRRRPRRRTSCAR